MFIKGNELVERMEIDIIRFMNLWKRGNSQKNISPHLNLSAGEYLSTSENISPHLRPYKRISLHI